MIAQTKEEVIRHLDRKNDVIVVKIETMPLNDSMRHAV